MSKVSHEPMPSASAVNWLDWSVSFFLAGLLVVIAYAWALFKVLEILWRE